MKNITTAFSFVAKNPATMLIAGGILALVLGSMLSVQPLQAAWPWLIGIGVAVHIVWLFL
ncbi:MAG TPA: hypothetical protein HA224_02650 [Nanoarchaeota archaeon]|nr:hypothetical protein [Nanoarchaeota archaeon]